MHVKELGYGLNITTVQFAI